MKTNRFLCWGGIRTSWEGTKCSIYHDVTMPAYQNLAFYAWVVAKMLANSQQVTFKHILLISYFENRDRPWHLDISYICKHFQTDIALSVFSHSEFPLSLLRQRNWRIMALRGDEEVANKQVILKDYVMSGFPRNSDMNVITSSIKLRYQKKLLEFYSRIFICHAIQPWEEEC